MIYHKYINFVIIHFIFFIKEISRFLLLSDNRKNGNLSLQGVKFLHHILRCNRSQLYSFAQENGMIEITLGLFKANV